MFWYMKPKHRDKLDKINVQDIIAEDENQSFSFHADLKYKI